MKLGSIFLALFSTLGLWQLSVASLAKFETCNIDCINSALVKRAFGTHSHACFVAMDDSGKVFRYNAPLCAERTSPCSTFKIFNSLAGLDSGVVKDADFEMKWDGTKYSISDKWNHDHTLRTAVRDSVVWYFQRVAAGVGAERMQAYLDKAGYGNCDISGGLTHFWLDSTLKISPDEQVLFLKKLYHDQLPFSERAMSITRDVLQVKDFPHSHLSGKTGSAYENGHWLFGWFVGYVVNEEGKPIYFATLIRGDEARGSDAREATEKILEASGLI